MKRKSQIVIISGLLALSSIGAVASTIAWFNKNLSIDVNEKMIGESNGAYFASGTGESGDPFIINSPVHLYNLAWLQYLGYFNNNTIGAESGPTYFAIDEKLSGPLDMTGWILPPIGTTLNPFVGVFNGNGKTIANATTINSSDVADYPKKPYPVRQAGVVENVNVLGLFGVVGECKLTNTDVTSIYPAAGYSANAISNFYIDNGHVDNYQSSTLAGIAAGYLNAPLSDVGILTSDTSNPSSVNLTRGTPTVFGGKTYLSEFTSIGFCEDAYKTKAHDEYIELSSPSSSQATSGFIAEQAGDIAGWGGSIGMDEIFTRLDTLRGDTAHKTQVSLPTEVTHEYHYYTNGVEDLSRYRETTTAAQNVNSYEFYDADAPLKGRVVFGQTQQNYLWGTRVHSRDYIITREYSVDCYYVKASNVNYYIRLTGGNATRTNRNNQRTKLFEDEDGWIYYTYNNRTYYLYANDTNSDTTVRSGTGTHDYMFKREDTTGLRLYTVSTNTASNRYVTYNTRSPYFIIGNATGVTLTLTSDTSTEETVDHQINHYTNGTYLPLNIYKNASEITNEIREKLPGENLVVNGAKLTNTGYIVGGTKNQSDAYGSGVRIASNYGYDDISLALGGSTSYSGSNLQVLTRTKDSNGVVFINDDYNDGVALSDDLKNLTYAGNTKYNVDALGLQRYTSSRKNLDTQFKNNTNNLYCMRFNEFDISLDNTITAEKVLLNGEIKENYVFPESCIDFNLKEKGYINFFGGGYRGGTCDAFFSLFHIIRDSSDNITSLERLKKIYGTTNEKDPYIYEYYNGTYSIYDKESDSYHSTSLPNNYSMYFDLSWVEEPGFEEVDNTVWYFEIPVNSGEYALGSPINTKTKTGAYMFYLDVGANATKAYRSTVVELVHTIAREFSRPLGIAIVAGATSIDDANSYCITIKSQYSGVVSFARASDTVATYTESVSSTSVYLSYAYNGLSVNSNEEPVAEQKIEKTIKRVTYFDYSASDNSTKKTVLSMVETTTKILDAAATTATTYEVEQYTKYESPSTGTPVDTISIIVHNDEGRIITDDDYAKAAFFDAYDTPTPVTYKFLAEYSDVGTIYAVITLTTNQQDSDTYSLFSARGYSVSIFVKDDQDVSTDITSQCTLIAKDNNTYVVDQTTGKILLVINEEFISNDTSEGSSNGD